MSAEKMKSRKFVEQLLLEFPSLRTRWDAHLEYWEGEEPGLVNDMIELADFFCDLLEQSNESGVKFILKWAEEKLNAGPDLVKDAICTGFFESVLNSLDENSNGTELLRKHIGENSFAYAKEWLSFSGGKLSGF